MKEEKSKKPASDPFEEVEIMPLKDFRITHNKYDITIKEGESVLVPQIFLQTLVTEKVIKKHPKHPKQGN